MGGKITQLGYLTPRGGKISRVGGKISRGQAVHGGKINCFTGSPFFVLTGDVVCTDVVGNGLPTLAFSRGIDMGEGRLWYGEGFRMV